MLINIKLTDKKAVSIAAAVLLVTQLSTNSITISWSNFPSSIQESGNDDGGGGDESLKTSSSEEDKGLKEKEKEKDKDKEKEKNKEKEQDKDRDKDRNKIKKLRSMRAVRIE